MFHNNSQIAVSSSKQYIGNVITIYIFGHFLLHAYIYFDLPENLEILKWEKKHFTFKL